MPKFKLVAVFLAIGLLVSPFALSAEGARQFSAESPLSDGTKIEITIIAPSLEEENARLAMSKALSRAVNLDRDLFSPDGIDSQISNLKTGETLILPPDAFDMISKAVELSALANGWYDVSAPSGKGRFTQKDWRRIVLDKNAHTLAFKSDGMRLDLRRIESGFIADIIMDELSRVGFSNAKVATGPVERIAGRDIFTPWSVQINFGGSSEYAHRAYNYNLTDVGTATVTQDGLGAGLIDAHSRKPLASVTPKSVTVLANDASTAVAYALAAYTLGPKVGLAFVEAHPETQGIIVDNLGALFASKGFKTTAITANAPSSGETSVTTDGGSNDMRQKQREEDADR